MPNSSASHVDESPGGGAGEPIADRDAQTVRCVDIDGQDQVHTRVIEPRIAA